jgi:hypothetical protein
MNIDNPIYILNCQLMGSFHFLTIHQQNKSDIAPNIIKETPLNTGLVLENMKKSMCFGSICSYFNREGIYNPYFFMFFCTFKAFLSI